MKTKINKIFIVISLFILCLTFVGCKNNHKNDKYEYFEVSEELKKDALDYLDLKGDLCVLYPESSSFLDNIETVKNGSPVVFVEFSESDYFYLCAYYDEKKVDFEGEKQFFTKADEYTWIGFNNEKEIHEYYNGLRLVATIQVNKSKECKYVMNEDNQKLDAKYMKLYEPEFDENKVNIKDANSIDRPICELSIGKHINYDDVSDNGNCSFSCVNLDGEIYFKFLVAEQKQANEIVEIDNHEEFGEYYDKIMEAMILDKHSEKSNDNKWTYYYGLVTIEDMKNIIFGE